MEIATSKTKDFCLEIGGSLKGWEESPEEEGKEETGVSSEQRLRGGWRQVCLRREDAGWG